MKKDIREALEASDYERVAALAVSNRRAFGVLTAFANDKDDIFCWRAIEAMGHAARAVDPDRPEILRNVVQRLIWSAREESGGMGWSAPELLAEIVCARPHVFADVPPIIVSLHSEDEENVFRRGVLWAIGRMAAAGIRDIPGSREILLESLGNRDTAVRGLAAWALARTRSSGMSVKLKEISDDPAIFRVYEDGELREATVGGMARAALTPVKT